MDLLALLYNKKPGDDAAAAAAAADVCASAKGKKHRSFTV